MTAALPRRTLLAALPALGLARPAVGAGADDRTLRFVPQAPLTVLDPVFSTSNPVVNHGYHVFDTLYAVDSEFVPRPQMAAGHDVSDDGLTWDIVLRDRLRFHDGTPVRAADCAASLQRWTRRDAFGQLLARAVAEWQAPDDRTLRLRLRRRFPLLLDVLAKPTGAAFIMPERLARTDIGTQVTEMVGSGPFRFVTDEFMTGSRAVYRRFEDYVPRQEAPDWASGGKVAGVDRIESQAIPDPSTAAAALQSGEIDWWEYALPDLLPVLRRSRDVALDVTDPNGFLAVLRFNTLQPPFNDPALRRAVLRAVSQSDYLALLGAGDGPASTRECHSFFTCGTRYGLASAPDPMATPATTEEARRMIAAAGYRNERVVILNPSDLPTVSPMGEVTYALLKNLGMNVDLQTMDWGTVLQRRSNKGPVEQGGWSIFHTWNTGASMANPVQNLTLRGAGPAGWFGWYDSPAMEGLATRWLQAETQPERSLLAAEMQTLGFQDVPSVPLGQFFMYAAYRKSVTGIRPGPIPFPWGVRKS